MNSIGTVCAALLLTLAAAFCALTAGPGHDADGHADACNAACACACCSHPALVDHEPALLASSPACAYVRCAYVRFRGRPLQPDIFRPPAAG